ncbi:MAG: class I SAM-dependent methyltransferase [Planctomycetota bacterium]
MSEPCRLCGGPTRVRFEKTVLGKHNVAFMECEHCGSMQTEKPYWLDESYGDGRRFLDINAASRAVMWQRVLFSLYRAFDLPTSAKLLDWGAGDGLLVRLLRDTGIDAYYYDPLAVNQYANGFEASEADTYDVVTAYEVWEHLSRPEEELADTLSSNPKVYVATTDIYRQQDESWPYLNLLTGRHVFFYSEKAVAMTAEKFGYQYHIAQGKRILLYKPEFSDRQAAKAKKILQDKYSRLRAAYFAAIRKQSLARKDRADIEARVRAEVEQRGSEAGNG